jgi:hypothetical protein
MTIRNESADLVPAHGAGLVKCALGHRKRRERTPVVSIVHAVLPWSGQRRNPAGYSWAFEPPASPSTMAHPCGSSHGILPGLFLRDPLRGHQFDETSLRWVSSVHHAELNVAESAGLIEDHSPEFSKTVGRPYLPIESSLTPPHPLFDNHTLSAPCFTAMTNNYSRLGDAANDK